MVDLAISEVNKKTHQTRTEISYEDKQIGEIDVQLTEYLELDNTDKQLTAVEAAFKQLKEGQARRNELIALSNAYEANTDRRIALHDRVDALAPVITCRADLSTAERKEKRREKLEALFTGFWKAIADQKEPERVIRETKDLEGQTKQLERIAYDYVKSSVTLPVLLKQYEEKQTVIQDTVGLIVKLDQAIGFRDFLNIASTYSGKLDALLSLRNRLKDAVEASERVSGELEGIQRKVALRGKYEAVEADYKALDNLKRLSAILTSRRLSTESASKSLERCKEEIEDIKKELHEAWEEAGGVCPLCGSRGITA